MGYTTIFEGELTISPSLSQQDLEFFQKWITTRRNISYNVSALATKWDMEEKEFRWIYGDDAEFYPSTGGEDNEIRDTDCLLDDEDLPTKYQEGPWQPGSWCGWQITADSIKWDGSEKFYYYVEWLEYLVHLLHGGDYTVDGLLYWEGDDPDDMGTIVVRDNQVKAIKKHPLKESDAFLVHQFTTESGTVCPETPQPMTRESVQFITRMILSELDELVCTVTSSPEERDQLLATAMETRDRCTTFTYPDQDTLIGAQFDALVDSWYYSLNTASKHGVNMSSIFRLVHEANMAKKDPRTGKFSRRADGKIIKPAGWTAPDISAEIYRQRHEGSFSLGKYA